MDTKAIEQKTDKTPAYSENAKRYARKSKAEATVRAYKAAWAEFTAYAQAHGQSALPAAVPVVVEYLTALADAGAKVSTIEVKRAAIAAAHRAARASDPTTAEDVKELLKGIRKTLGIAPVKKAAISRDDLLAMLGTLDTNTIKGKRDKALLLVGFCGAFRRSELVALDIADVKANGHMTITVKRGKTDQEGAGLVKHFEDDGNIKPVSALRDWLDNAGIKSGAVFRQVDRHGNVRETRLTSQSVALVVKQAAKAAGLDWRAVSGHSLRAGFITAAAIGGAREWQIAEQTGHKSTKVLQGYIRGAGAGALDALRAATGSVKDDEREKA